MLFGGSYKVEHLIGEDSGLYSGSGVKVDLIL
jgi:hypothetical protein